MTSPAELRPELCRWRDAGWLRRLDVALANFVVDVDPAASPALQLATALLVNLEGQGHTCLPLAAWRATPARLLDWPAPGLQALHTLLDEHAGLPPDAAGWWQALVASPAVRDAHQAPDIGQPLVAVQDADGPRLYLRRHWQHERRLAQQLIQRSLHDETALPTDPARVRDALDRLFPAAAPGPGQAPDWQKLACAIALRGRITLITGGPGTGKTYTAARLLALQLAVSPQPERLRIALAAPTGKAAARLKQAMDSALASLPAPEGPDAPDFAALTRRIGPARTLHALLGARPDTRALRHHAGQPLDLDLLIVDEASMIHLEMMAALLDALPATTRLVLLGDKDQLASVEAGAVLGDLCRGAMEGGWDAATVQYAARWAGITLPLAAAPAQPAATPPGVQALGRQTVMLRESRRFGGPIGQLALAVHRGDAPAALALLADDKQTAVQALAPALPDAVLRLAWHGRPGAEGGYQAYLSRVACPPAPALPTDATGVAAHARWVHEVLAAFDGLRILTAVREGDWGAVGLNRAIARRLTHEGLLQAHGEWYAGRPVMVTRNDPSLGVYNGDIGMALPNADGSGLKVWFAAGESGLRAVGTGRLTQVDTAFAMTVHKSQGSEFDHTVLVLPPTAGALLSRELVYTGITRARSALTVVSASAEALAQAVRQPTERASGLLHRLAEASSLSQA